MTADKQERLYNLLPMIYRMRDAELGYPLKALLAVVSEQVNLVEDDIAQLYENWFIETCQDWVTPYIADLIGFQPVQEAGLPGDPTSRANLARNKILFSRREVANTIRSRRRKGTLALLEELAADVAGWPARAIEFYRLLGWAQNINHLRLGRARTVDVRSGSALDLLGGPFDAQARTIDVRRAGQWGAAGRSNLPGVGVFVWRLKAFPITRTHSYSLEEVAPHCYTFNPLQANTQLYSPGESTGAPRLAGTVDFPAAIRRRDFAENMIDYYGEGKSLAIWADWADLPYDQPVPMERILAADLSDWEGYYPTLNTIAVDPELGRFIFPPNQTPQRVRVSYHYAFSAEMGGGEYDRPLTQPAGAAIYQVGENETLRRISQALELWQKEQPADAVIEITDSGVYIEQIQIQIPAGKSLQIRAANRKRPVIRLLDWHNDRPDPLIVELAGDGRFTLDGIVITGRPVHIKGERKVEPQKKGAAGRKGADAPPANEILLATQRHATCLPEVTIRHCTLVPGWRLDTDCEPQRANEPSLEVYDLYARVWFEHSILGSIHVNVDPVKTDPLPITIEDSIVDATSANQEAIGAPGFPVAHVVLEVRRSTVFGIVDVHAIELAENSIFNDCLNVARRQLGCMRFCYVAPNCRTPRRYHCQPDQAIKTARELAARQLVQRNPTATPNQIALIQEDAAGIALQRVRPSFTHRRYNCPGYGQLAAACPEEITHGADDESEMGAFHDLFQPQREANLRTRLEEFTPAGMDAGIIFVN